MAQSTQGTNKGMDFLVALQSAEQFTLVKNIKCNKVRETAYPLGDKQIEKIKLDDLFRVVIFYS